MRVVKFMIMMTGEFQQKNMFKKKKNVGFILIVMYWQTAKKLVKQFYSTF